MRASPVVLGLVPAFFLVLLACAPPGPTLGAEPRAPRKASADDGDVTTATATPPTEGGADGGSHAEDPSPPSQVAGADEGPTRTVCRGQARPPRPSAATCCYPTMEPIRAAMRALHSRFAECHTSQGAPEGRVLLRIAVGTNGEPDEVCGESAVVDPSGGFLACVVEATRAARFPPSSDAQERVCGSMRLAYPIQFSRGESTR